MSRMRLSHIASTGGPLAALFLILALPTLPAVADDDDDDGKGGGEIRFFEIADDDETGIDYRRLESPAEALFDLIRQQPTYTFQDLLLTPLKARGAPGVALLDYDRDGDLDIYVTNGPGRDNSLYSSQLEETGELTFVDVAGAAGVAATDQDSTGVCYGDIDNDGDEDLVVLGNLETNRLFENQGDGSFLDISLASGVGLAVASSTSCSFGDINGDGLLDLAVSNVLDMVSQFGIFTVPFDFNQANQLLLNQGGNSFTDVTASSGFLAVDLPPAAPPGAATISWAIAMVDLDLDGDTDIVHADDQAAFPRGVQGGIDRGFLQFFENDGSGSFTNVTIERDLDQAGAWMGLAFADVDANGYLDVFGTNFGNHNAAVFSGSSSVPLSSDSRWFLQQEDGRFADTADQGFPHTPFGWGCAATDYDNDGDTDLVFHGGLDVGPFIATNPGSVLRNDGSGNFSRDFDALAESTDHLRRTVHGFAVGDLDNDGFIDLVSVSNQDFPELPLTPYPPLGGEFQVDGLFLQTFVPIDPPNFLFEFSGFEQADGTLSVELNDGDNDHRSITIETLGTVGITSGGRVNRNGIGAVVAVEPRRGQTTLQPVLGGSSYASQNSLLVHAGLGRARLATVDVLWPGGVRNRLHAVRSGSRLLFPEIPCSFDDPNASLGEYTACVHSALSELREAGILSRGQAARFAASAVLAFLSER